MEPIKELINKYLVGNCTAEEARYVEQFLSDNPQAIDELFPVQEWDNTQDSEPVHHQEQIYDSIAKTISRQRNIRRIIKIGAAIAASLLLFLSIHYSNYFNAQEIIDQEETVLVDQEQGSAVANLYYINSDNKAMNIAVSDGSQITLYPKSEVRFAENFDNSKERIIELKGKAKFEVAKDKTKPFRVRSKGLVTSALGTVFIVDEFAAHETNVNLIEGAIEVQMLHKAKHNISRIIRPQESLCINHQSATILKEIKVNDKFVDRESYYTQDEQNIVVKNLAIVDVLQNLEYNFAIQLTYDRSALRNKYFSGTFVYSPSVYNQIIEEINYLHKANILKK